LPPNAAGVGNEIPHPDILRPLPAHRRFVDEHPERGATVIDAIAYIVLTVLIIGTVLVLIGGKVT
jgi:hypothetical protein